jgi:hypothetical protein
MSKDVLSSDFSFVTPPDVDIPGMITPEERRYYYWLTSEQIKNEGAVVEVGTWLGCSSAHLAAGRKGRAAIYCYDHFIWSETYNPKSEHKLHKGDDFSHLFKANMEKVGANVIPRKSTMRNLTWDGGKIELLVLDAPKQAVDLAKLLEVFGPSLMPGKSYVVLQDYQYFPAYQIAVVMDAIRESATLVHVVTSNARKQPNTVAFRIDKPINPADLATVVSTFKSCPKAQIVQAWSRIMKQLPPNAAERLAPGLSLFLYDAGHVDAAFAALDELKMQESMLARWRRLLSTAVAVRYKPLFEHIGLYRETDAVKLRRCLRPSSEASP